ncbi:MAG TPA: DnaD domain protein [Dehalococcoidia bacterium]|nr:DnaD domain protein [Dehalococcoidia bacterium]
MPDRQLSSSQRKTDFISLPDSFFTQAMPKIQDLAELKIVLYVSYLILRKQERPYFVTYKELLSHELMATMGEKTLRQALDSAVEHGTLLHSTLNINGVLEDVYALTVDSRQPPTINIFALYEQNIGLIQALIAEELKEAEKLYPPQWIEEAFKEAVTLNKRNWRYIASILRRWASEGKDSGEYKRDIKKDDPDKYIKGKYGHMVRR